MATSSARLVLLGLLGSLLGCGRGSVSSPTLPTEQSPDASGPSSADDPDAQPKTAPEDDVQYLTFQLNDVSEATVGKLVDVLQSRGDGKRARLAFAAGPLTLSQSDDELRATIGRAFAVARSQDVAVAIHIDDSMFWAGRTELIADPNNVEWSDWAGTVYAHRVIGWAPIELAPPICYESPTMRTEVRRVAKDVIGAAIADEYLDLRAEGRGHLFAGVIAGWETRLDDDRQPEVPFGYCSLTHLGFSADKPPPDVDAALVSVVERWIALWSESLRDAGVPPATIYTHVALTHGELDVHAPALVAFNAASRAGFSVYATQLPMFLSTVKTTLANRGNPRWAMAEGANAMVGCKDQVSPISWEVYLGKLFNGGAALVNLFGWMGGVVPTAANADGDGVAIRTNSDEAVAAYKKFLSGETLDPADTAVPEIACSGSPFGGSGSAETLQSLLQELQEALQAAAQRGVDISSFAEDMEELNALMQAGDLDGAIEKARSILTAVNA
ncbi:MAG TPA: hypothetical protein VLC93_09715 [Myxococcota bacterium]|nr:hypothetical protein [Myxococcota bacterium]